MLSDDEKKRIQEEAEQSGIIEAQPFTVEQLLSFISDIQRFDLSLIDFRKLPATWNMWLDYNFDTPFSGPIANMLQIEVHLTTHMTSLFYLRDGTKVTFFILEEGTD
jgi:hypothetical protein